MIRELLENLESLVEAKKRDPQWKEKLEKLAKKIESSSQVWMELDGSYSARFSTKKLAKQFVRRAGKKIKLRDYWEPSGQVQVRFYRPGSPPIDTDKLARKYGYGKPGDHRSFWA
jgi:hypothetical protein